MSSSRPAIRHANNVGCSSLRTSDLIEQLEGGAMPVTTAQLIADLGERSVLPRRNITSSRALTERASTIVTSNRFERSAQSAQARPLWTNKLRFAHGKAAIYGEDGQFILRDHSST
jgi:hypothetical protein